MPRFKGIVLLWPAIALCFAFDGISHAQDAARSGAKGLSLAG